MITTYASVPHDLATLTPPAGADPLPLWPPVRRQIARKPLGGFFLCPIPYLTVPWALYQDDDLQFFDLRVWCAILELPERRHDFVRDHEVHYSIEELGCLLHAPRLAPVAAAVKHLEELGLLTWSTNRIVCFPHPSTFRDGALAAATPVQAQLPTWRTWVPAPRRLLRWLAREGTPGLWATAAGVLLRCLWSRARQCVSGGRITAHWVANGFGLATRTVHRAFDALQACDWLARLPSASPTDAARARRHGAFTVVNLFWNPPVPDTVAVPAVPPPSPDRPRPRRAAPRASGHTPPVENSSQSVENPKKADHNVSPPPPPADQNLSLAPAEFMPYPPVTVGTFALPFETDLYPLQEEEPDSVPVSRARETMTGIAHDISEEPPTTPARPPNLSTADIATMWDEMWDDIAAETQTDIPAVVAPLPLTDSIIVADVPQPLPSAPGIGLSGDAWAAVTSTAALLSDTMLSTPCTTPATAVPAAATLPAATALDLLVVTHHAEDRPAPAAWVTPAHGGTLSTVFSPTCDGESAADASAVRPAVPLPPVPVPAPVAAAACADPVALFAALPAAEQDAHLDAAKARLLTRGFAAAALTYPALLVNVYAHLTPAYVAPGPVLETPVVPRPAAPERATPETVAGRTRQRVPDTPSGPTAVPGIWAADAPPAPAPGPPARPTSARVAPPSLSHVIPADLGDRARLEVLRQQAITRRWLTGSEADRVNFMTAAVHARRIGDNPCALFVAIVRSRHWEFLTDGDEDQARALLTEPPPSALPRATAPAPVQSADARFVQLALSVLRQDGWSRDPFEAIHQEDPSWTRARWDVALAEVLGRRVGGGLERLGRVLEGEA